MALVADRITEQPREACARGAYESPTDDRFAARATMAVRWGGVDATVNRLMAW